MAAEAGMLPYRFTMQDEEKQNRWKIYKLILEKYSNFCHEELNSGKYKEVAEYLIKRKITKKEIIFFKIGYSPAESDFYDAFNIIFKRRSS